jgi:signal transduction histidine kinase
MANAISELIKQSSGQEQSLYVLLAATGMRVSKALAVETRHFTDAGRTIIVRSISHLLHPPLLDEVGLRSALHAYVEGLTNRSGIETSIDVQPPDFPRLAPELETAIFRIVQEALTNVSHAASVALAKANGEVRIKVRDDGKGIANQVENFRPGSVGLGVSGMRQRVSEIRWGATIE